MQISNLYLLAPFSHVAIVEHRPLVFSLERLPRANSYRKRSNPHPQLLRKYAAFVPTLVLYHVGGGAADLALCRYQDLVDRGGRNLRKRLRRQDACAVSQNQNGQQHPALTQTVRHIVVTRTLGSLSSSCRDWMAMRRPARSVIVLTRRLCPESRCQPFLVPVAVAATALNFEPPI